MDTASGNQEELDAAGLAYVRFALANPRLLRLMRKAQPGLGDTARPAMQELQANIATLLPKGTSEHQLHIRAQQAWFEIFK